MTTAKTPKSPPFRRFPDPPEIPDEKMTAAHHLASPATPTTFTNISAAPKTP